MGNVTDGQAWSESGVEPYASWYEEGVKGEAAGVVRLSSLMMVGLVFSCLFSIGL